MNLDENVQKTVKLLLSKWKILVVLALIGSLCAYVYTAKFVAPTYTSSVEFLATATDISEEMGTSDSNKTDDSIRIDETSKMNYAMKMISTYLEIFQTNEFCNDVASDLNQKYNTSLSSDDIKKSIQAEAVEDTAMFKMIVTTTNPELSFQIAHQLEESIPNQMKESNNGLVKASVEDKAVKATTATSRNYPKNCLIGLAAGLVLACLYIILRDLFDIRVKSSSDLSERYEIPVLGSIPDFDIKTSDKKARRDNQ